MPPRFGVAALASVILCLSSPASAQAHKCLGSALARASAVWLTTLAPQPQWAAASPIANPAPVGSPGKVATGVLVSPTLVLTVHHVLQGSPSGDATQLKVHHDASGRETYAVVKAASPVNDLLLLELYKPLANVNLPYPVRAESPKPFTVLDHYSVNQGGKSHTTTVHPPHPESRNPKSALFLSNVTRFDATLAGYWGDSGSGLFTCEGELAGLFSNIVFTYSLEGPRWASIEAIHAYFLANFGNATPIVRLAWLKEQGLTTQATHAHLVAGFLCQHAPYVLSTRVCPRGIPEVIHTSAEAMVPRPVKTERIITGKPLSLAPPAPQAQAR